MNNKISELIEEHMDNVEKAARRYYRAMSNVGRSIITLDDLRSAGYEGLTRAANNFSSEGGASFTTFAYTWINKTIEQEILFFLGEQTLLLDEQAQNQLSSTDDAAEDSVISEVDLSEEDQAVIIKKKLREYHLSEEEIVVYMALKGVGREKVTNLTVLAKELKKREIFIRRINQSAEEKIKLALKGGV